MFLVTSGSYLMGFHLIRTAGAVFYSETAYTMANAGVVWAVLLLCESFSANAWLAVAVLPKRIYLVEPTTAVDRGLVNAR